MKVFVAGASGAIGLPLVAALVRQGHAVTGMTHSELGAEKLLARGAKAEADERVRIMDWWAGRSREMEAGDTIIPLRATGQIVG